MNLMFMVPGVVGGSEPLLTNLVASMLDSDHEFTIFGVKGFGDAYPQIRDRTDTVEVPWSSGAQALRIAAEHSWLAVEAKRRKLDILHHGVGTTPFIKAVPTAVTIHDAHIRHYPENFIRPKRLWLRVNVPYSIRHCEVVAVPSRWVKDDLVAGYRVSPDKVAVIPFGSEGLFGDSPAPAEVVSERYRLERPYFFFPGRTYPHKNHRFLIDAFVPLASEADLVLTGPSWFRDEEIFAAVRHSGLEGKVRHLGRVPRADLAGIYEGAIALVYPSRFEGFGAPVLEAMSAGCPVISSNVTALPEVVADAGILLDPLDGAAWTEAMQKVAAGVSLRQDLIARGRARAAEFSWARSADLQLAAYKQAVDR